MNEVELIVAGFGNPLLDITVKISDKTLLDKYQLNDDDQKELSEPEMKSLLLDIKELNKSKSPGGCAQNTLRVLQWLLTKPNLTLMFGCIGDDEEGKNLKGLVEKDGVQTHYIIHKTQPTGTSIALTNGPNRSLVAHLGAAEYLTKDDFNYNLINYLNNVNIIYMEGFFLTKRTDVAKCVLSFAKERQKIFVFNLSATYMCDFEPQYIKLFSERCDILFGNKREFTSLAQISGFDGNTTPEELAVSMAENYADKNITKYNKIVVITNGSKGIFCAHSYGKTIQIDVPHLNKDKIKDTTGAGDSFVAGFLAGLFLKDDIPTALQMGCLVAQQIIQQSGCTIPVSKMVF